MKIIVVGDLHGEWNHLNKLINKKDPNYIFQCGDFGWWPKLDLGIKQSPILYNYPNKITNWKLKGVKPKNTKVFWCDGNHEEHPTLSQNGKINEVYENIFHASRGSTLEIDGLHVLFCGGADSIDKNLRTAGHDWFPEENITQQEFEKMMSHDKIDIVISHTCPLEFEVNTEFGEKHKDVNRQALSEVLKKYRPHKWFFGHWHMFKQGQFEGTKWCCLDYPNHRGRWWIELK